MTRLYDPFAEMDRFFGPTRQGALMPMDVYESDGTFTLRFDLAGANPDKVDVTVEDNTLTVTAERPVEETSTVNWLVRERPTGTHSRQIRLGNTLDTGNVVARYDQGVLTVTIPVRPEAKPQKVAISTGSADKQAALSA